MSDQACCTTDIILHGLTDIEISASLPALPWLRAGIQLNNLWLMSMNVLQLCRPAPGSHLKILLGCSQRGLQPCRSLADTSCMHCSGVNSLSCSMAQSDQLLNKQAWLFMIQVVDNLSTRYNSIPPHLRKIEELVSGTNTGKAPALATYYQHWEALLFSALTSFVLASMRKLLAMFNPKYGIHTTGQPLFQVWCTLQCKYLCARFVSTMAVIPMLVLHCL